MMAQVTVCDAEGVDSSDENTKNYHQLMSPQL